MKEAAFQSPVSKRWLWLAGGVVLTAMMLLAGYSLVAGADSGPVSSRTGPASQPAVSGAPSVAALSEPPDIRGRISVATPRALTIETQTGPRVVGLTGDTRVILEDGSGGTREDLTLDTPVAVVSETRDGGRTFTAKEIAVLPR